MGFVVIVVCIIEVYNVREKLLLSTSISTIVDFNDKENRYFDLSFKPVESCDVKLSRLCGYCVACVFCKFITQ